MVRITTGEINDIHTFLKRNCESYLLDDALLHDWDYRIDVPDSDYWSNMVCLLLVSTNTLPRTTMGIYRVQNLMAMELYTIS